jgi:hypothetical protein
MEQHIWAGAAIALGAILALIVANYLGIAHA